MEQKVFIYKSKFSYWVFLPSIILFSIAAYCYLNNASITIKGKSLIEFPYSYYIAGGLSILSILYSLYEFKNIMIL